MKTFTLARMVSLLFLTLPFITKAQTVGSSSSFDLYQSIANGNNQNIFFSPFSVNAALSMAYAGSESKTRLEFEKVMGLSNDKTINQKALEKYINGMNNIKHVELKISNNLWHQSTMPLFDDFEKNVKLLNGKTDGFNFIEDARGAEALINKTVSKQTNGKIPSILADGTLNQLTRFVMTNAIYFMGNWDDTFDPDETTTDDFWVSNDSKANVKLMNKQRFYKHAAIDDFQMVEIPYKGKAVSMIVILPNEKDGLTDVERHFNAKTFSKWLNKMENKEVQLSFPKFKMGSSIDLSSYLTSLGLETAFTEKEANFSAMMQDDVFLSKALHKSFVEVNEKGTEASAATAVIGMSKGINLKMPVFKANHPFIYIIKENLGDEILFMGRFNDPRITETKFTAPAVAMNVINDDKFIHVVSKGETLFKIASLYDVKVKNVRKDNLLEKDIIFVGQKLLINRENFGKGESAVPTAYLFNGKKKNKIKPVLTLAPAPSVDASASSSTIHKVKKGETLYRISRQYGISVKNIKTINNLTSDMLSLGQELILEENNNTQGFADNLEKPQPKLKEERYTVKKGNTLSQIAKLYDRITVTEIKKWNNLKSDMIFVGQQLKIYQK